MEAIAIFDIGKTNKKLYLFDKQMALVESKSQVIDEVVDELGMPCDDLSAIEEWIRSNTAEQLRRKDLQLVGMDITTYGASMVYLDGDGKRTGPFLNYLTAFPKDVLRIFTDHHEEIESVCVDTCSPFLGMLNAGMQIYWLKLTHPEIFARIDQTLFLPQYLSYLFTGQKSNDYASLGCHTMLWDYKRRQFHRWVEKEGLDTLIPVSNLNHHIYSTTVDSHRLIVGSGLHDSTAALLPYYINQKEPFLLLSTGTWSICFNPFDDSPLTKEQLQHDCLCYMLPDGNSVKASRLFLGKEYAFQLDQLSDQFGCECSVIESIQFNLETFEECKRDDSIHFPLQHITHVYSDRPTDIKKSIEELHQAYHRLMYELVLLQMQAIDRVSNNKKPNKGFIVGGFAKNQIFIHMLNDMMPEIDWVSSDENVGSAFGLGMKLWDHINGYIVNE